ncbi:hypothetical protein [Streptomyces flavofungini]|uniref:Secreted protein n=1 Tax=Streptomyces flavofungini TaxID=68200 RepID=A0ABS0XH83_9ACTN|nr:hypothetical protein [Streptomyces flavofungini]MBJ3812341.1 hypothetical protein [Streptomyces flavofungini]GHC88331.1 hypothetical protein GCM10010349_75530 [Streptomyces flavofungini]
MIVGLAVVAAIGLLVTFGPKCRGRHSAEAPGQQSVGPAAGGDAAASGEAKGKQEDGPRIVLVVGIVCVLAGVACLSALPLRRLF